MKASRLACLCWAAVLAAGSAPLEASGSVERFPIGIYGVGDPAQLAALDEAGFDSFHPSAPDTRTLLALAREARRRAMRMLFPASSIDALLSEPGANLKSLPIEAWYLQDEPELHRVPPADLERLSRRVRELDPKRLQTLSLGIGSAGDAYGSIGDFLMLDWYPVPHRRLDSVADQLDSLRRRIPAGKPVWMIVQAMDWKDYSPNPSKPLRGRFPHFQEIRLMSWLSLLHGAQGLYYFAFTTPQGRTLPETPELWQAVARVVREFHSLQRVFERGKLVPLPFPPNPDGVEARAWLWRNRFYVVVLNRKPDAYQRLPEELLGPSWRPLFETRRDPRDLLKKIGNAWYLSPHRVLVFEKTCGLLGLFRGCR